MTVLVPILLIGLGGFLLGGVLALWRKSVPAAVLLGVFCVACIIGGVLWLMQ